MLGGCLWSLPRTHLSDNVRHSRATNMSWESIKGGIPTLQKLTRRLTSSCCLYPGTSPRASVTGRIYQGKKKVGIPPFFSNQRIAPFFRPLRFVRSGNPVDAD